MNKSNTAFLKAITLVIADLKDENIKIANNELEMKLNEFVKVQAGSIINISNAINNYTISLNRFYSTTANFYKHKLAVAKNHEK